MRLRAAAAGCLCVTTALALLFVDVRSESTSPSTSSRCPAPGSQDGSWEPSDVVECSGPCITKIVPDPEAVKPDEAGGFLSLVAVYDVCEEMQGELPSSGCPVRTTAVLQMPPTVQEEQFYFAAGMAGQDDRLKLWLDNTLIIDQWASLSSWDPMSTGLHLDPDAAPYKIVWEYTIPNEQYSQTSSKMPMELIYGVGQGNFDSVWDLLQSSFPDDSGPMEQIHENGGDYYDEDGWRFGVSYLTDAPIESPTIGASRTPVTIETSCVDAGASASLPLPCPSPQHAGGTSVFVDRTEGFTWQCCYGDDCVAEFTALRDLDIYPSDHHCKSEQVRACTDPIIEAYKCQHGHKHPTFDFVDPGNAWQGNLRPN